MAARTLFALVALLAVSAPAFGADAVAGRGYFRAQCALCHSAEAGDNGGAQGPNLQGVLGRKAGSSDDYAYTAALKNSGIVWDAASLQSFLANPTGVVPGSAMVIPVPNAADRENLAAYFAAVKEGTLPAEQAAAMPARPATTPAALVAGTDIPAGPADWKKDAPGRVHRIDLNTLPASFATASARNLPRVVRKPEGAKLSVPSGFHVEVFLEGVTGPRTMLVAPNGDVILAETKPGNLKVLRPTADGKTVTVKEPALEVMRAIIRKTNRRTANED
jgi:cytochrome c2